MKRHRIKFFSQTSAIALLAVLGLIALSGEPVESLKPNAWMITFAGQLVFALNCWASAWLLSRHWGISRKMRMIEYRQKQQMKALSSLPTWAKWSSHSVHR